LSSSHIGTPRFLTRLNSKADKYPSFSRKVSASATPPPHYPHNWIKTLLFPSGCRRPINHRTPRRGPFEFSMPLISLYELSTRFASSGAKICYIKTINVPKGRGRIAPCRKQDYFLCVYTDQFPWSLCQRNEKKNKEKNNLSVFHYYLNTNWFFVFCGLVATHKGGWPVFFRIFTHIYITFHGKTRWPYCIHYIIYIYI